MLRPGEYYRVTPAFAVYSFSNQSQHPALELAACATLEFALKDRYWCEFLDKKKELLNKDKKSVPEYMRNGLNSFLSAGLRFMVDYDGLNDEKLQIYNKSGGVVIDNLFSDDKNRKDTLVGFRNSLAHGDPFDGIPIGSFLEVVRDLIEYIVLAQIRSYSYRID